jgi:hypothetical protein
MQHIQCSLLVFINTWKTVIESQLIFWAVNVIAHVFVAAPQHLGLTATRTWLMTLILSNSARDIEYLTKKKKTKSLHLVTAGSIKYRGPCKNITSLSFVVKVHTATDRYSRPMFLGPLVIELLPGSRNYTLCKPLVIELII